MSDMPERPDSEMDQTAVLKQRAEQLEREIVQIRQVADARVIKSELKTEAIRAGMVDLDGLKLIEISSLSLTEDGVVPEAAALMDQFKKAKPWLFGAGSSSSPAAPPAAQPARTKLATEMTDAEYKAARAAILKQRI
jgi:hypothetical protein